MDAPIPTDPPPKYEAARVPAPTPAPNPAMAPGSRLSLLPQGRRPGPPLLDVPILNHLRKHRVVLASASPRRRALLGQVGLTNLEIWPSTEAEDLSKELYGPFEYVAATARRKCLHVYEEVVRQLEEDAASGRATTGSANDTRDPELVIAADTVIVSRTGQVVEKPRSAAEHTKMLRHLRDTQTHKVLTAVCVLSPRQDAAHPGYVMTAHTEETTVVFAREADGLTDAVIESYVRTREGADKAGGYALQGAGGLLLVQRIEGSVDNVVGLPVRRLLQMADKVIFQQDDGDDEGSAEEEE